MHFMLSSDFLIINYHERLENKNGKKSSKIKRLRLLLVEFNLYTTRVMPTLYEIYITTMYLDEKPSNVCYQ